MNGINRSCSVEPYESNEKVGRANGLSDDPNLQLKPKIQLSNNNILTHRRAVPQPPCSSRLLLPRRGAIAMDPLRKRGKMRAFTATNVSEASGSLSRRFVPEASGSRRNPSASEVSVPIPKWRSNVSQSSRPKKRWYETAGILQTTGAKFHRQEDKRQQTASEQCSTASNPLSAAEEIWFRDCQAQIRDEENQVRDLHESIGQKCMMMRRMKEKDKRTNVSLSETPEQDETGAHSTLPAAEAPTQTEAALKPMMQPPRQLQKTNRPPRAPAAMPPPPPPPPWQGRSGQPRMAAP